MSINALFYRVCVRACVLWGGGGGDISAMYVVVGGTKVGVLSADIFSKRRSNKLTAANTCETSLVIGYLYNIQKIKSMYGLQNVLIVANAGSTRRMQARNTGNKIDNNTDGLVMDVLML